MQTINLRCKNETLKMNNANPSTTIADVINYLKTQDGFQGKEIEIIFQCKKQSPETLVSSLGLDNGACLIVRILQDHQKEAPKRRAGYKMPDRDRCAEHTEPAPSEINEYIVTLKDCGFTDEAKIRKALEMSFYCVNRAAIYLANGDIPDKAAPEIFSTDEKIIEQERQKLLQELEGHFDVIKEIADELKIDFTEAAQYYAALGKDKAKTIACFRGYNIVKENSQ
ncbi:ubiquitin-like family [Trichomonas vaginalis G3]|uniref:ubiquitin-like family n=1 Tax=Trichomonas vaginalis (strain ATCC PRA-98 / G3) TaxID=412133 RepID=UPI0021E55FCD|nr:ubiquitin-like family [Trichomonas vaginalis G3]KAI5545977.1 ubiquitin-like family [Trichomonas vaginalis G3]